MPLSSKRIAFAGAFLLVAGVVGFEAVSVALFAFTPLHPGTQDSAIIEIHKGQGPAELSKELAAKGAIQDAKSFAFLGRLSRQWKKIKAGEYKVSAAMTPLEIFSVITSGISIVHPVTVREGENMYEIAADIEAKGLMPKAKVLALCKSPEFIASLGLNEKPPTLEGYLFPDTYFFNRTQTAEDMLRQMVKHFLETWNDELTARAKELGMTRFQILTLASMVEKETGAPQERPMISSVFHNRLKKKMKLQSDPTTIYGIWDRYKGNIHKSDLLEETPYNTYTVPALPAGPISNPGKESLQAALYPASTDYLFFVSHNDGTHEFTRTYEEHTSAVRKFQLDPKAREGKSWRDLSKKLQTQSN